MPSHDILDKLFDVEKKAEEIAFAAKEEASKRMSHAKEEAEAAYKAAYESRVAELAASLEESKKRSDVEFRGELASYRASLESAALDQPRFIAQCEAILSGKA